MRKYSLFCDCCGKEVENLYTINFKAAEGSEGDDYYLPDIEICEDCIDETCGLLKEWLTSPDVVVEDEGNEEVKNNEMVAQSYGNYPDVDCHIPAIVCDTYEDCSTCPYNDDTDKTNIPDLEDCNELENGETPTSGINLNEAIQNLNDLTEQFYNATSAPTQKSETKETPKVEKKFTCNGKILTQEQKDKVEKGFKNIFNSDKDVIETINDFTDFFKTLSEEERTYAAYVAAEMMVNPINFLGFL